MDFAIDQAAVQTTQTQTLQTPALATHPPNVVPAEMLLSGRLIRLESAKPSTKLIQVLVRDLYESEGNSSFAMQYAIREPNHTRQTRHRFIPLTTPAIPGLFTIWSTRNWEMWKSRT